MKFLLVAFLLIVPATLTSAQTTAAVPASTMTANQNPMAKLLEVELLVRLCNAQPTNEKCKDRNLPKELADVYTEIIRNKEDSTKLIGRALESDLARMQLVVIAQNQRIIELLEELVKKK